MYISCTLSTSTSIYLIFLSSLLLLSFHSLSSPDLFFSTSLLEEEEGDYPVSDTILCWDQTATVCFALFLLSLPPPPSIFPNPFHIIFHFRAFIYLLVHSLNLHFIRLKRFENMKHPPHIVSSLYLIKLLNNSTGFSLKYSRCSIQTEFSKKVATPKNGEKHQR